MPGTVLLAHPSPDLYGADLQLVQTVSALVADRWRVVVALPQDGPLVARLRAAGAAVEFLPFPVLRKALLHPRRLAGLVGSAAAAVPRAVRLLRRLQPSLVLVNTVTLPWWVLAGRLGRVPTVVHLHEAESAGPRVVRAGLLAPLRLATGVLVISRAAEQAMVEVQPALAAKARLVYNGVPGPGEEPTGPDLDEPVRLAVVGRLSPRKAPHVALEALAQLRAAGHDVELEVAGSTYPGYEWYEDRLRERAARPDLAGHVHFSGYCSPVWPVLQRAAVVLAPSLQEPFGNVVVEAQLCRRPVVAAAAHGHLESIEDGGTGVLVTPDDAPAMAAGVRHLLLDPALARRLAERAEREATRRFSVGRYRREIAAYVAELTGPAGRPAPAAGQDR